MFTQTIKRWFNKLFAWWPWRQASVTGYPQAVSMSSAITPEQVWRTMVDGPATQPGASPVAVEHGEQDDEFIFTDEYPASSPQPFLKETLIPSTFSSGSTHDEDDPLPQTYREDGQMPLPSEPPVHYEQHLDFLRYLFQRGLLNEGFAAEKVPDQYRPGQEEC
jgi:hypothetical protein